MSNEIAKLATLNLKLPAPPQPVGNYNAVEQVGDLLFISGQLPIIDGKVMYQGQLGAALSVDEGVDAASLCALNILSQIEHHLGLDRLVKIVKVEGYISAITGFEQHANVLNGASDLLAGVLGEKAGHIRTVVGCTSLPLNVPVEISVIAQCL
ncbi:MAG: RidA family protein [Psychrobium sp.]